MPSPISFEREGIASCDQRTGKVDLLFVIH